MNLNALHFNKRPALGKKECPVAFYGLVSETREGVASGNIPGR